MINTAFERLYPNGLSKIFVNTKNKNHPKQAASYNV